MRCKFRALLNLCFFSYINCHSILITNAIEFYMCLGFGILEVFLTISSGQHYVLRMHVCLTFPPEAVLLEWTAGSGWFLQNFWVRRKNFNSFKLAFDFEFVFFQALFFTSLGSRVGRRCQSTTLFLWWNCVVPARWQISHGRFAQSISSWRTLI
jgi:hypothetical protein